MRARHCRRRRRPCDRALGRKVIRREEESRRASAGKSCSTKSRSWCRTATHAAHYSHRRFSLAVGLGQTRWLLFAQSGTSISTPFLVVVVFWLTALFVSFGLFAPRNATAVTALVVSAISVAGALFLVLELDQPFSGIMQLSDAPLRDAIAVLGR